MKEDRSGIVRSSPSIRQPLQQSPATSISMGQPIFKRIVLKMSGEVLGGGSPCGIDSATLHRLSSEIGAVQDLGVETAVVIGGGNFIRGASGSMAGVDRITSDSMGMLGTIMNALALRAGLEACGRPSRVFSAVPVGGLAEPFCRTEVLSTLRDGCVVVFGGGTGHPFFSTDTTAVLRGLEIGAEAVLTGTKVDGVYSADPALDPQAKRFDRITFSEIVQRRLKVVDATAAALCIDHDLPLIIFNIQKPDTLVRVMCGELLGTLVKGSAPC